MLEYGQKMKNILFIRSDRLGEFILSLPAIKLVKANYPASTIYLLAQKSNIELAKEVDFIDYFLTYSEDMFKGYRGAFRLAQFLKKEKIDCVIILNPKKEFHLASFMAGIPLRVGYDRKWGFCLNKKIKDEKYLAQRHEVSYSIDLVSLICRDVFIPEMELPVDSRQSLDFLSEALDTSGKYVVIHPFTSHEAKRIGDEFWVELVDKIKKRFTADIVIIGEQADGAAAKLLEAKVEVKSIVGKLSLRNLAAFLKYNCRVFIGLDSGPMHLASMLKVPVVGLFKASISQRWGPFGSEALVIEGNDAESFTSQIKKILDSITEFP